MNPTRDLLGRQSEGGGPASAPLAPHPASTIFPPMTDDEFAFLCHDIAEHGLVDDIVLLDGQILEGNHRYRACLQTGTAPRFTRWEGDDPIAFVLSKNLHRRHLTPGQKAAVAVEAEGLYTKAARRRQLAGKADLAAHAPQGQKGQALEHAAKAVGASRRSAQDAKSVRNASPEVFAELKTGAVSIRQALKRTGRSGGGNNHAREKVAPVASPVRRQVPDHVAAQARIRAIDAERKYASMLAAPEGKLNIPLLERASKIQELLLEVTGITPEKAVSGIPALRCREYSVAMAEWWLTFARLCDERRQAETPELPTVHRRPRLAAVNPVVQGGPVAPAVMSPAMRAVHDWMVKRVESATVVEVAVAAKINRTTAGDALRKLMQAGIVEMVGTISTGSSPLYLYQFVRGGQADA